MLKWLSQGERFHQELRLLQERMNRDLADVPPTEPAYPREATEAAPRGADAEAAV